VRAKSQLVSLHLPDSWHLATKVVPYFCFYYFEAAFLLLLLLLLLLLITVRSDTIRLWANRCILCISTKSHLLSSINLRVLSLLFLTRGFKSFLLLLNTYKLLYLTCGNVIPRDSLTKSTDHTLIATPYNILQQYSMWPLPLSTTFLQMHNWSIMHMSNVSSIGCLSSGRLLKAISNALEVIRPSNIYALVQWN
jgi:hypothetical protein